MRSSTVRHVNLFTRRGGSLSYPRPTTSRFPQVRHASTGPKSSRRTIFNIENIATSVTATGLLFILDECFDLTGYVLDYTSPETLNQEAFTSFTLQSKEPVSSTASIFTLLPGTSRRRKDRDDPYEELWKESLWSVQAKQPQLQIARDYTPLPPSIIPNSSSSDRAALRILIRHEVNGEMSKYLNRLPLGTKVDLRGPRKHFDLEKDQFPESVIFCAGGTGIAPALQCAYAFLSSRDAEDPPRMHILWASRRREDCEGGVSDTIKSPGWLGFRSQSQAEPVSSDSEITKKSAIVEELEALKKLFAGRLTVDYFVDESNSFIGKEELQMSPALNASHGSKELVPRSAPLVLVSGPDGFTAHLAGPKGVWHGKEVQGPLGGLLGKILEGRECTVWKL